MRVERHCVIDTDREAVWKVVSDPGCYPSFMPNLARWEAITEGAARIGARYTVHWKIGSVPLGGVIEVVEFDEPRDLAWTSITGITLRGRFRLREANGSTKVTFRLSYQAPGGLLGLVADRVASRQVGRTLAETLKSLKAQLES
jgi:uncharacterized membrane protein